MTFRCYINKKFKPETMDMIRVAASIVEKYEKQGLRMTLRQLYYQMVVLNYFPNSDASYNRLGGVISDARMAGLISWESIEDRQRYMRGVETFAHPSQAFKAARDGYRTDLWADQPVRLVFGIEKDALVGVISDICYEERVDFTSFRGYSSQSQQWRLGQQFARYIQAGQRPMLIHLGDHDPDGIDMTRDLQERLSLFAGAPVQVIRIALNKEQVEKFNPPNNPAKPSSSRYAAYQALYGESCWELDALPPDYISRLISDTVRRFRDPVKWEAALAAEAADRDYMDVTIENMGESHD